jgi:hypothetical protein
MIFKDDKVSLSNKIVLYHEDRGIDIYFTLSGFNYKFKTNNLSGVAIDGKLLKPSGVLVTVNNMTVVGSDKIKFTIDEAMTDELTEIGIHTLQISLYDDSSKVNRITMPPITFEVKESL